MFRVWFGSSYLSHIFFVFGWLVLHFYVEVGVCGGCLGDIRLVLVMGRSCVCCVLCWLCVPVRMDACLGCVC